MTEWWCLWWIVEIGIVEINGDGVMEFVVERVVKWVERWKLGLLVDTLQLMLFVRATL